MSQKHLTILTDMDDVLENLTEVWTEELRRMYNVKITAEDITDWDIASFYSPLSKREVFEPLFRDDFWQKLSPIKGAPEVIRRFLDVGHTVKVVTASYYRTVPTKIDVLLEMFPMLSWKDVIVTEDKSLIQGDVLVDDAVHNIESTICPHPILFDRPHNRRYSKEGVVRAKTWEDVYEYVTSLACE